MREFYTLSRVENILDLALTSMSTPSFTGLRLLSRPVMLSHHVECLRVVLRPTRSVSDRTRPYEMEPKRKVTRK